MGLTTWIVLTGIALGCLQLAVGVMIGRHLPLPRNRVSRKGRLRRAYLGEIARRLGLLVNRVADDVGQHQARIAQVNRKLSETETADANALAEAVLGAIAQMVESDARLQQRLAQAEEKLQRQSEQIQSQISEARTDPLTELPNRRAFRDELDRQIAQWQRKRTPFSLLMIDVDHFKALNDRYGHPAGDHALREIGLVLKAALRDMDLVARVGGEEFAAVLPGTSLAEAVSAAERVREAVQAQALRFEQWELRMTVSVGLAVVDPRDGAVSLIRRADEALYASKRAGRNCGHYHDGETCRPIAAERESTPTATAAPPASENHDAPGVTCPAQPDDDRELRAACEGLRARLIEVTRSGELGDDLPCAGRTA